MRTNVPKLSDLLADDNAIEILLSVLAAARFEQMISYGKCEALSHCAVHSEKLLRRASIKAGNHFVGVLGDMQIYEIGGEDHLGIELEIPNWLEASD